MICAFVELGGERWAQHRTVLTNSRSLFERCPAAKPHWSIWVPIVSQAPIH